MNILHWDIKMSFIWTFLRLFSNLLLSIIRTFLSLKAKSNVAHLYVHVQQAKIRLNLTNLNAILSRVVKVRPKIAKEVSDKDMSLAPTRAAS